MNKETNKQPTSLEVGLLFAGALAGIKVGFYSGLPFFAAWGLMVVCGGVPLVIYWLSRLMFPALAKGLTFGLHLTRKGGK